MTDALIRWIDKASETASRIADWCVLAATLVSAGNAVVRYTFSWSSNALLELQWYLFAGIVMLAGANTLRLNEHVRVDLLYGSRSERTKLWIDAVGFGLLMLPVFGYLTWLAAPYFWFAWTSGEVSIAAGGLALWPAKALLVFGLAMLWLQGLAEFLRRVLALQGARSVATHYERPLQ